MKTLTTSMLLGIALLSAGTLTGASRDGAAPQEKPATTAPDANVTVVTKNGVWPPAAQISMEPCNVRRCLDV